MNDSTNNNFAIEIFLKDKDGMEWIMDYFDKNGTFKCDTIYVGTPTSEAKQFAKSWFSRKNICRMGMKIWPEERQFWKYKWPEEQFWKYK